MESCLPGDARKLHPVARQLRAESPVITQLAPLLLAEECDYIIEKAKGSGREPSQTGEGVVNDYRTSTTAYLPMKDPVVACLANRLATVAGMPPSSVEKLQVTAYENGEEYRPHTDDPKRAPAQKRLRTIFAYLSDGLADGSCGGATTFTKLGSGGNPLRVFPHKGQAVMWSNYTPEGKLDTRTEHAGEAVTCEGTTKWGLNAWFHGDPPPEAPRRLRRPQSPQRKSRAMEGRPGAGVIVP